MTRSLAPDATIVSLFQQHWHVYRNLVEGNFLSRRKVYARLDDGLAEIETPFRFLESGCALRRGNSRLLSWDRSRPGSGALGTGLSVAYHLHSMRSHTVANINEGHCITMAEFAVVSGCLRRQTGFLSSSSVR